jgi:hypothetical protein
MKGEARNNRSEQRFTPTLCAQTRAHSLNLELGVPKAREGSKVQLSALKLLSTFAFVVGCSSGLELLEAPVRATFYIDSGSKVEQFANV